MVHRYMVHLKWGGLSSDELGFLAEDAQEFVGGGIRAACLSLFFAGFYSSSNICPESSGRGKGITLMMDQGLTLERIPPACRILWNLLRVPRMK